MAPDKDQTCAWGVWATGEIARRFAEDLRHVAGARLHSVCSRDAGRAAAFANRHGFGQAHSDAAAFLADPALDIVYIASPHTEHCAQALAAIDAGKSVLIEKPVTMTAAEARQIDLAAKAAGVFAMEAMWTRFLPSVQRARAMIEAGAIGNIRAVKASLIFHRPFDPSSRLFDPALGGGALHDLGVYPLSVAHYLTGPMRLERAAWDAAPNGVNRAMTAHLTTASGVPVDLTAGFIEENTNPGDNTFDILGTKGAIRINRHFLTGPSLTIWSSTMKTLPSASSFQGRLARKLPFLASGRTEAFERAGSGLEFQAMAVQAALGQGLTSHPVMPMAESANVLDLIEAILERGRPG